MRLLVTGGAGFIGSNFVLRVARTRPEWQLVVLDALTYAGHRESLAPVLDPPTDRVQLVHGSVTDAALLDRLVRDVDAVVHFAAESHNDVSLDDPAVFVDTNVVGTFRVLEAVRRHGVRLHHVSTDEVHGDLALDDPTRFDESSPLDPSSPYSATKASADLLVRAWVRSFGVRATISRSSNNYGPRQHVEKFVPRQVTRLLRGLRPRLYGSGAHVRDWIHVDDHNDAVLAVLERGRPGETYLVGADGERSNREVLALLLELTGHPRDWFDHVPDRPGHDLRYAMDSTKIREELGWRPTHTDLRAGLAETVRWYADNEQWWGPQWERSEEMYRRLGR